MPSPAAAFPAPAPALDAARERVVRLLTDRYADDTLTVEAFEAQLDRMHALTSVAALDAMAADLATPASTVPAVPAAGARRARRFAGLLPPRVFAFMSNTRRSGRWAVPPHVRVSSVMSEVTIDLREAVLPSECEIEVFACMGAVKLWLPLDARPVVGVDTVMGSITDRSGGAHQAFGPVVRVTGSVVMGELKIRQDDW